MKYLLALAAMVVTTSLTQSATAQSPQGYTIGRMLSLEDAGLTALSPDGRITVFERKRPYDERGVSGGTRLFYAAADAPGDPRPLFEGQQDSSYSLGYFSPGGRYLSYRRRSPGAYVLGVFDFVTGKTTEFAPNIETLGSGNPWVSDTQLVERTTPPGQLAHMVERTAERLERLAGAWKKRREGREDTSSPIGSGRYSGIDARVPADGGLVLFDARTGEARELAQGDYNYLTASPDGKTLATIQLRRGDMSAIKGKVGTPGSMRTLVLFDLKAGRRSEVSGTLDLSRFGPPAWTPDGRSVVFNVRGVVGGKVTATLWQWDLGRKQLSKVAPDGFELAVDDHLQRPRMAMLEGDAVALGRINGDDSQSNGWYRLRRGRPPQLLSGAFGTAVPEILASSSDSLIALTGGEVWRIDGTGRRSLLTGTASAPLRMWRSPNDGSQPVPPLVAPGGPVIWLEARATPAAAGRFIALDIEKGVIAGSSALPPSARLYSVANGRIAYTIEDGGSLSLVAAATHDGAAPVVVRTINPSLRGISAPQFVKIEHKNPDGAVLSSYLLLPRNYRAGQRLPLIAHIYPGTVYSRPPNTPLNWVDFNNPHIWAEYGYAYLFVSVPRSRVIPHDPAKDLAPMILSAVDAAIAAGYVDKDRIALHGHSFGGWGTLMTISQTNRFKAAVALAAPTNEISDYGVFDTLDRMTAPAIRATNDLAVEGEDGRNQMGLGAAPWQAPQRYMDASPLFQVEKINTPVMLVQGDLDYVSITQGEEMFTALRRMNRDALFVRYWGEWHTIGSPANIRDLYARRLAWFDEHLDLKRDERGEIVWDGDKPASRNGVAPRDRDWFLAIDRRRTAPETR